MLQTHHADKQIRCPACRATQKRQTQCRRCRADLTLLVRAQDRVRFLEGCYRQAVNRGQSEQAAKTLSELRMLHPSVVQRLQSELDEGLA